MKTLCLSLLAGVLLATGLFGAEKTDLAKENYVENSATNFTLAVKDVSEAGSKVRVFEVTPPQAGEFTLLCFVDGKFFRRESAKLPGQFSLSIRGLSPGTHQVTIQAVDANGQVGRSAQEVMAAK